MKCPENERYKSLSEAFGERVASYLFRKSDNPTYKEAISLLVPRSVPVGFSREYYRKVVQVVAEEIGLNVSWLSNEQMTHRFGRNKHGATDGTNIWLNIDLIQPTTFVHELSHIWLAKIEKEDPSLFNDIQIELIKNDIFLGSVYEGFAFVVEEYYRNRLLNKPHRSDIANFFNGIKKKLNRLLQYLYRLFGTYNPNYTLQDIIERMESDLLRKKVTPQKTDLLFSSAITSEDIIKEIERQMNMFSELKIDSSDENVYVDNNGNHYIRTTKLIQHDEFIKQTKSYTTFQVDEWVQSEKARIEADPTIINKVAEKEKVDRKKEFFESAPQIGSVLHYIAEQAFLGNDISDLEKKFPNEMKYFKDDAVIEKAISVGEQVRNILKKRHGDEAVFFTESSLLGPEFTDEFKNKFGFERPAGKLDIIVLEPTDTGEVKIYVYDYKFSNKQYEDWSRRKIQNIEYQQALYQMYLANFVKERLPKAMQDKIYIESLGNIISVTYDTNFDDITDVPNQLEVKNIGTPYINSMPLSHIRNLSLKPFFKENLSLLPSVPNQMLTEINNIFMELLDYNLLSANNATKEQLEQEAIYFIQQVKAKNKSATTFYNLLTFQEEPLNKNTVIAYLSALKETQNEIVQNIYEQWNRAKNYIQKNRDVEQKKFVYTRSLYLDDKLNKLFEYYLSFYELNIIGDETELVFDWELLPPDEVSKALGVLVFKNNRTEQIQILSISLQKDSYLQGRENRTIFSKLRPNEFEEKSLQGFEASQSNIGFLKAALYALSRPDIQSVDVFYTFTGDNVNYSDWRTVEHNLKNMRLLLSQHNLLKKQLKGTDYKQALISLLEAYQPGYSIQSTIKKKDVEQFINQLKNTTNQEQLLELLKSRLMFLTTRAMDENAPLDIREEIRLLSRAINDLREISLFHEKDLFSSVSLGQNKLLTLSSDITQMAVKRVMELQYKAQEQVRKRVVEKTRNLVILFNRVERERGSLMKDPLAAAEAGMLGLRERIFANLEQYHQDKDGKWVRSFMFRDPDKDDVEYLHRKAPFQTQLSALEKELLREVLNVLNSLPSRQGISNKLHIPLIKAGAFDNFFQKVRQKGLQEGLSDMYEDLANEFQDPLWKEKKERMDYLSSILSFQSVPENREKMLVENPEYYFEKDIQTYVYLSLINEIKTEEFNKVIPEIVAIRSVLLYGSMGIFSIFPETLDYIQMLFRTNILGRLGVSEDERKAFGVSSIINRFSTDMLIGFNVEVSAANVLNNLWNTISAMQGLFNDRVKYQNVWRAFQFTTQNIHASAFNNLSFINAMNQYFGVFEMSLSKMSDTLKTGEKGIRLFEHYLHYLNQYPDYFFRMMLFIAEMLEEGVLVLEREGGILRVSSKSPLQYKDNKIVYDPRLDKRFDKYLAGKVNDPDYKRQESLYIAMLKDLGTKDIHFPYTWRQIRDKLKRADMIYQNTDPMAKSWMEKTAWGNLLVLFKRWIQTRYNIYFRDTSYNEFVGYYHQEVDENGNIRTYWRGQVLEGIAISLYNYLKMAYKARSLVEAGRQLTPEQLKNLKAGLTDIIQFALMTSAAVLLYDKEERRRRKKKEQIFNLYKVLVNSTSALMFFNPFLEKSTYTPVSISYLLDRYKAILRLIFEKEEPERIPFELLNSIRFISPAIDPLEEYFLVEN